MRSRTIDQNLHKIRLIGTPYNCIFPENDQICPIKVNKCQIGPILLIFIQHKSLIVRKFISIFAEHST